MRVRLKTYSFYALKRMVQGLALTYFCFTKKILLKQKNMSKHHSFVDTVDQVISDAVNKGIMHLNTEDVKLGGNKIKIRGNEIINFGSCSYLGLEFDPRMIAASQEAIANYGTQFSSSRAYVSSTHYQELEGLFDKIFGAPSIVAPTTTLGHMGAIPILINDEDLSLIHI